ncbi:MAG: Nudix family hydrolase [Nitrospirae bacterium]|nr:MAG: Nudix family hydrolase [Nitrospirota bacterium]
MLEMLEVVAAVILKPDGQFLLAERPPGKVYAGYWEFPGGKVEAGETPHDALARELHEELGIEVDQSTPATPWLTRIYTYPHATVHLRFFRVTRWHGEAHGKESQRLAWQAPDAVTVAPLLPANGPILRALGLPGVYAITHAAELGMVPFLDCLEQALSGGLRLIQVRETGLPAFELERFAAQVVRLAHVHGARVLVNSDMALARKIGADGVHLKAAQLMALSARPDVAWCGASTHNALELARAAELGLDFAVLSPVKPTLSHTDALPLGWETFAALAAGLPLPVYALGGLSGADMADARRAGAHGIAMQRGAFFKGLGTRKTRRVAPKLSSPPIPLS